MRFLRRMLTYLVVLVIAPFLTAVLPPRDATVARGTVIETSPEAIFTYVNAV